MFGLFIDIIIAIFFPPWWIVMAVAYPLGWYMNAQDRQQAELEERIRDLERRNNTNNF